MKTIVDSIAGYKTYITLAIAGILLFGSWQGWWKMPPEIYGALAALATAFVRAGISREIGDLASVASTGAPAQTTQPGAQPSKGAPVNLPIALALSALAMSFALFIVGCSTNLSPTGVYGKMGTVGTWLWRCDTVVDQGYNTLDTLESWTEQNQGYLQSNAPTVIYFAATVRTNAPKYFADYSKASVFLRTTIGTAQEVGASNAVLAAFAVITNVTTMASQVLTNTPGLLAPK